MAFFIAKVLFCLIEGERMQENFSGDTVVQSSLIVYQFVVHPRCGRAARYKHNVVAHIAKQQKFREPYQLPEYVGEGGDAEALAPGSVDMKRLDPMFADVARYVVTKQEGSTSRLQRAFEIGYNRAGKLSDQLEAAGIVGPNKGPKGRDVLIQDLDQLDKLLEELGVK